MAVNIGPKIGIDGEAQFRKEINNLIQQQKTLASEMKAVTSSFDANDKSQEAVTAQTKVLNQQIEVQKQRIEQLQKGLQEASQKYGEADSKTLKWKQAVNDATAELNQMKSQLSGLENGIDDVGDAMDDASQSTLSFKDVFSATAIVEAVKGIAGAISDVVESTTEYRKIIGTLETSSQAAGYTANQTSEAYSRLYEALGDTQTAATATANLQALKLNQQDLMNMLDLVTGAWATYGDSIPIDSLAESINETIRSGTVTGTFADVLNWGTQEGETFGVMLKENTEANQEWNESVAEAETAEDYFNLALQSASSEAERANIVMQAMASQGLADTASAWYENNQQIVDANDAQLRMQEAMASFAETVGPAVNEVKAAFAETAAAAAELAQQMAVAVQSGSPMVAVFAGIATAAGALAIALNMSTIIQAATNALTAMKTAMLGLNAAMAANPIGVIVALISGLVAAVITLWTTNEGFRDSVISIAQQLGDKISSVVSTIKNFFTQTIPNALNSLKDKFEDTKQKASSAFSNLGSSIKGTASSITSTIRSNLETAFSNLQSKASQTKSNVAAAFSSLQGSISSTASSIWSSMTSTVAGAFQQAGSKADEIRNSITNTFWNLWNNISTAASGIRDTIVGGFQSAVSYIQGLASQAYGWGQDMIRGLVDGIMSWVGNIADAARNIADTITGYLHFSRPDVGPLREYESWMPDMMAGMAKGIRKNSWQLEDALNAATSHLQVSTDVAASSAAPAAAGLGNISITINAAPGMDVNALADAVAYKLQHMVSRKEAVW